MMCFANIAKHSVNTHYISTHKRNANDK